MSNTEAPISITASTADKRVMVTVRADSGPELDQLLAVSVASIESAVKELQAVTGATAPSAGAHVVSQAFPGAQVVETPPFSGAPSLGGGRSCQHGKMTALQGPSKQGGVYKGYFCPSAQGDPTKCKTIYVNKTDPEWNTFVPDRIK